MQLFEKKNAKKQEKSVIYFVFIPIIRNFALAKAIANEHGGDINAFNKVDGGACFEITIPLVKRRDQLTKLNNLRNLGN